jgi:hypothetical protein
VLHWATENGDGDAKQNKALLRRLQERDGLPILDCSTNLRGLPARVFSRAMQRDYVRRWENGFLNQKGRKLTRGEVGICRQPLGAKLMEGQAC